VKLLYLLRHAKSSWKNGRLGDHARPLNKRGRQAARTMGEYMARENIRPGLILCSTAMRARETLDLWQEAFGDDIETVFEDGLYHAAASALLERIHGVDNKISSLMLIGHNPGMEYLGLGLAAPPTEPAQNTAIGNMAAKYPTAALAVLEADTDAWKHFSPGTVQLERFVRPKDIQDEP